MRSAFLTLLALAFVSNQALAGQFHIKNCLKDRIYVCSYNKDDGSLTFAADTGGVEPGKTKEFKCSSSNGCKVFMGVSNKHIQSIAQRTVTYMEYGPGELGEAGVDTVGAGLYIAAEAGEIALESTVTLGVGGAVIGTAAVALAASVAIGNAVDVNNLCKTIIKKVQHGNGAKLKDVSGHHTLGIITKDNGQKMAMGLLSGSKTCDN